MLIYAHRGSSATDPENTLRAFQKAIQVGADGIELDVHMSSDGVPVVIHDRDLSRTTDRAGHIDELTLADIKEADAGQGERVPTLREALEVTAGKARLYIEVKQEGIAGDVLAVLRDFPAADWCIASFDYGVLRDARSLAPNADIWIIALAASEEMFAFAADVKATAVSLGIWMITDDVADRCRNEGLALAIWTVNDIENAKRSRDLGAIGLCTDDPAAIIAGLAAG